MDTGKFTNSFYIPIVSLLDGNGRTGRLAMNYLLVLNDYPPIIIHEEDRKEYYAALQAWDTRQDLSSMCDFLRCQTEKTWEKQIARAERKKNTDREMQ